jgi:transketolase
MTINKNKILPILLPYFLNNKKIVILNADDGLFGFGEYLNADKSRIYNVGIAEQAIVGIAAGMAMVGLTPLIYAKIPFITMRAFEQLRYDVNEHNLNVKILGVGANNYNKPLGRSHCMDDDDLHLFKMLNNFNVYTPTDETARYCVENFINIDGPTYIRCE